MKAGRCSSPRTLYEPGKLQAEQPERVAELVTGTNPITRDAVAEIRDSASSAPVAASAQKPRTAQSGCAAQMLFRATALCIKLDAALTRLGTAEFSVLPADDVAKPRQRVALLARRTDA